MRKKVEIAAWLAIFLSSLSMIAVFVYHLVFGSSRLEIPMTLIWIFLAATILRIVIRIIDKLSPVRAEEPKA